MATQYIKYAKKCEKKFVFSNYGGGGEGMVFFGLGVATPMLSAKPILRLCDIKKSNFF